MKVAVKDTEPILDRTALEKLRLLDGGHGTILDETVAVFLQTTPQRLEDLAAALTEGDHEALERHAHTIKSSSTLVGGMRLAQVCKQLEDRAYASTLSGAQLLLRRIGVLFHELRAELHAEL